LFDNNSVDRKKISNLFLGKYSQHLNSKPVLFKIPIDNLAFASNILAGLGAALWGGGGFGD